MSKRAPIRMFAPYVNDAARRNAMRVLTERPDGDRLWIGEGSWVYDFENRLAEMFELSHVVAVNSGTAALHLALIMAGVQAGHEVKDGGFAGARSSHDPQEFTLLNLQAYVVHRAYLLRASAVIPAKLNRS